MSSYTETARLLKSEENPRDNQILQRMLVVDGFSPVSFDGGAHIYHVGKVNFSHSPLLEHYETVSPEREAVWLSAQETENSWMFLVAPTGQEKEVTIRASAVTSGGEAVRVSTENVYFAGSIDRVSNSKENTLKELIKLEKERETFNRDTPIELRELLVELAVKIAWTEFNGVEPYLRKLYTDTNQLLCRAYVTFRGDGMTHEEAAVATRGII